MIPKDTTENTSVRVVIAITKVGIPLEVPYPLDFNLKLNNNDNNISNINEIVCTLTMTVLLLQEK